MILSCEMKINEVKRISLQDANKMMDEHHYLGSCRAASKETCFGAFENGLLVAAAIYAIPHAPKIPNTYRDLRRLVASKNMIGTLSSFLSKTLRELYLDGWDAAITWADQAAGHHGGIYQATNWVYVEPKSYNWNSSYRLPDGSVRDHRSIFKEFGTTSKKKMKELRPEWEPFLPKMKFRYVYPLNKNLEKIVGELKAKKSPYPKPFSSEIRRKDYRTKNKSI